MYSTAALVVLGSVLPYALATPGNLFARACAADNCYRAVGGTAIKQASTAKADCTSFLQQTVTPCPTTIYTATDTVYVTLTTTTSTFNGVYKRDVEETGAPQLEARQATTTTCGVATGAPKYASLCSGAVRYSSACSCIGVTAAIVTTTTPTVYAVSTTTSTIPVATKTAYPCVPGSFYIQVHGASFDGQYVQYSTWTQYLTATAATTNDATPFGINSQGHLYPANSSPVYISSPADPTTGGAYLIGYSYTFGPVKNLQCSISGVTLLCSVNYDGSVSSEIDTCLSPNLIIVGSGGTQASNQCSAISMTITPITCAA